MPGSSTGVEAHESGNVDRVVEERRWQVTAQPEQVSELRHQVAEYARQCGMSDARADDVRMAVSEAVANSVLHAYLDREVPGAVTVRAWPAGDELAVVVCDDGSGMRPRVDSPGAGMGLSIIGRLADSLRTQDRAEGGLEVGMSFELRQGSARRSAR